MNKYIDEDAKIIANSELEWDKLKNKTLLISGATGYIPQYFIHGILKHNDIYDSNIKVVAVCRNENKAEERFGVYKNRKDFELVIKDVCDFTSYDKKVDYIIHAASPAGIKDRYKDYINTFRANVIGCDNLLRIAKQNDATLLFLSSVDSYGKMNTTDKLKEDMVGVLNPLEKRDMYSNAKRASETLCIAYFESGVDCKIVRPFQILGSGIPLDDGRLHIDFISQILKGDKIVLKGDGTPRRNFIYVTDAIIAMMMVMLSGQSGQLYNIAWEENDASVLQLATTMASLVADRTINIEYNYETRKNDPAVTKTLSVVCGDSSKIMDLGWKAKMDLRETCKRMMQCYGIKCK